MISRRIASLTAALVIVIGLAAGTALSATAATSSATSSMTPAYPVNSCKFWRAHLGPWARMRAVKKPSLVWTVPGTHINDSVVLSTYGDRLSQCWKAHGSFGNGEFEFQRANTGMCIAVKGASRKVNASIVLYPCLSKTRELFKVYYNPDSGRYQYRNVNSGLCIQAKGGLVSGHRLVQAKCSFYGDWQSWMLLNP